MGITLNLKSATPIDSKMYKARIEPGVHDVIIMSVEEKTNQNGKEYIELVLENLEHTRTHTAQLYCSTEKATEWTARRIREIFVAIYGTGREPENLVIQQLKKALVGKSVRILFIGKQVESSRSKELIWITEMRLSNFAESVSIPKDQSRLVFIPEKHMKAAEITAPNVQMLKAEPAKTGIPDIDDFESNEDGTGDLAF